MRKLSTLFRPCVAIVGYRCHTSRPRTSNHWYSLINAPGANRCSHISGQQPNMSLMLSCGFARVEKMHLDFLMVGLMLLHLHVFYVRRFLVTLASIRSTFVAICQPSSRTENSGHPLPHSLFVLITVGLSLDINSAHYTSAWKPNYETRDATMSGPFDFEMTTTEAEQDSENKKRK